MSNRETTMRRHGERFAVLMLILAVTTAACARRPQLMQAAAPAPTGAAVTEPSKPGLPAPAAPPSPPPPAVATPPPAVAAPPPPAPVLPAPAQFREVPGLKAIYFDFDKSVIRPDAARILDANIDWMKSNPDALILIEGHCDERGTNEYNLALGDRRAKATVDYLPARGVVGARLTTISYGEERPVCTGQTAACWDRNRRAHFLTKAR
jgi:peptidoglycan-associated lipoprotein